MSNELRIGDQVVYSGRICEVKKIIEEFGKIEIESLCGDVRAWVIPNDRYVRIIGPTLAELEAERAAFVEVK